ncbi:hypothetical protein M011DRAFT_257388 [Sporormia fimetaria CBS 119925]|uniref:MFS general substrate transporter n=1 Tax=Sporormia fimetaria CBS 119925 TaxID=1340428 RepID=A0A6A6UWY8_9PLEO|nr:hypothetical protein M011DRAFT_257388 [Sporormia fimetaria CBS 119925]
MMVSRTGTECDAKSESSCYGRHGGTKIAQPLPRLRRIRLLHRRLPPQVLGSNLKTTASNLTVTQPTLASIVTALKMHEVPFDRIIQKSFVPFLVYGLFTFCTALVEAGMPGVWKYAVCRSQEHMNGACRGEEVGNLVDKIVSGKMGLQGIGGLSLILFHGGLAERYGTRNMLLFTTTGYLLTQICDVIISSFPTYFALTPSTYFWTSGFIILTGGTRVLTAMVLSYIAEKFQHGQRRTLLYALAAVQHCMSMIGRRVASTFGEAGVFLPAYLAIYGLVVVLTVAYAGLDDSSRNEPSSRQDWQKSMEEKETRDEKRDHIIEGEQRPRLRNDLPPILKSQTALFCFTLVFAKSVLEWTIHLTPAFNKPESTTSYSDMTTMSNGTALLYTLLTLYTTLFRTSHTLQTPADIDNRVIRIALIAVVFLCWTTAYLIIRPSTTLLLTLILGLLKSLDPAVQSIFAYVGSKFFNHSFPNAFTTLAYVDSAGETMMRNVKNAYERDSEGNAGERKSGGSEDLEMDLAGYARWVYAFGVCIFLSPSGLEETNRRGLKWGE